MAEKKIIESFDCLVESINLIENVSDKNINLIIKYFTIFKKNWKKILEDKYDVSIFLETSLKKIDNKLLFLLKFYNLTKTMNSRSEFKDKTLRFIYEYCNNLIFQEETVAKEKLQVISHDYKSMCYLVAGLASSLCRNLKKAENGKSQTDVAYLDWFCATTIYLWFVCRYRSPESVLTFEKALAQYYTRVGDEKEAQRNVMRVFPEALESKTGWKGQFRNTIYLFWDTDIVLQEKDDQIANKKSNIDRLTEDKKNLNITIDKLNDRIEKLESEITKLGDEKELAIKEKDLAIEEQKKAEERGEFIALSSKSQFNIMRDNLFSDLRIRIGHQIEGIEVIVGRLDEKNAKSIELRLQTIKDIIEEKTNKE